MWNISMSTIYLLVTSIIYFLCTKIIFDNVYLTSKVVVDEEFHLAIGQAYCKYEYNKWDPKITTLPGLYLVSSFILGPLKQCGVYYLRSINIAASILNFYLFYFLLKIYNKDEPAWKNILSATNLGILPPLYFFTHLYYTDTMSLTFILLMVLFHEKGYDFCGSIFGFFSIIMRQTNIIWVLMILGKIVLDEIYHCSIKHTNITIESSTKDIWTLKDTFLLIVKRFFLKCRLEFWFSFLAYLSIIVSFGVFIYLNGGIVVGDKTAHKATLHVPQLFYFALFSCFFGWPFFATEVFNFVRFAQKYLSSIVTMLVICVLIVHHNTLVHPYMLADNRHYIFYIWHRFYARYESFRYLITVVYVFAMYVIMKKLWSQDVGFALPYTICIIPVLIMQKLIEFRYFLVPFILFRLKLKNPTEESISLEFLTNVLINVLTFYTFFNRELKWNNYDYPQRIMW
ncbi:putative Dol-P-Glc:Glc(2)Man(9)GlcNAc(2)-PP-Dol alpha-1,2-glucosyltransferase [Aethina tumida]|uniref:putative Dol-P-Glc:Glc(2)Man(9)GlcNAc(2)-PP-Dol alpha-1,2-glucosyltransferase n=1 Tax=Aethina tumida TaxID=116153 RepID=UPI00096B2AFF|nr:putative Dol-P-Glc:Glc(2)Man(9)GlcNAc(2)-PP-Dol alpha-1,2-glucosyltransferase [Aethina tumida]